VSHLVIFRDAFAENLRRGISSNLGKYADVSPWAETIGSKSAREMETNIELRSELDLALPAEGKTKDLENAIRVHKALSGLTPVEACDRRLWTRLSHIELWNYMRNRWPVERHTADSAKAARFIESRYFVPQRQSRALLRNGIARLWWAAHLSYDDEGTNPYSLTAVLLSSLDITQQLLERNFGRAPAVARGFLRFLHQHEELLRGGDESRRRIRQLAKYLNLRGGVSILDCLSVSDVMATLESEFVRITQFDSERARATV
jgi:hypothetical protein